MTEREALKIAFGWYKDAEYPSSIEYVTDHEAARVIRHMYQECTPDPDASSRDPHSPHYDPE